MMTSTTTWHIDRPGGRRVTVRDLTPAAAADAPVVLLCHAAPGAALFDPDPEVTEGHGVRLVALDRPGYGGSDPATDAFSTVDSAADDAAAVLGPLLVDGVGAGVAGWSAGGRVALALAARRPDLVDRVAVIGTPAPDDEVPWVPAEHRAGVEALRGATASDAHKALSAAFGPTLEAMAADERFGLVGVGDADAAVLARGGVPDRLRAMLDDAFRQGAAGMVADIASYMLQPWGFAPADVAAEVLLAYGGADPVAGHAHGAWWQRRLPNAQLETMPGVGHLVVVPAWDRVLAHLVAARH